MSSAQRCARVGEGELCYHAFGPGTLPPPPLPPLVMVLGRGSQIVPWTTSSGGRLHERAEPTPAS